MSIVLRKTLLCLVAVFALSALTASAASADAGQELVNGKKEKATKTGVTTKSGESVLTVAGISVKSKKSKGKATVTSKTKVTKITVTFEESEAEKAGKKCKVNSPGEAAGTIKTKELTGEFGEVAKAEATSEVGELFEPSVGKVFVELEGTCIVKTKVEGQVAGEATPTKKLQETGEVVFKTAGGKQSIKTIERSEGDKVEKPKLKAFGLEATQVTKQENKFEEKLELIPGI